MAGRRDEDEDAPWLAEAAARPRTDVSKRSLFWTLLVLLSLAMVAAVGLVLLLSKKDSGSTQGYMNAEQAPLIAAEPGPYKVTPLDPKGLAVEGQDQTIYAAGEGIDEGSFIDPAAGPEALLPRPGSAPPGPPPGLPRELMPDAATMTAPATALAPAAAPAAAPKPAPKPPVKPASPAPAAPGTATNPPLPATKTPPPALKTPPPALKNPPPALKNPPPALKIVPVPSPKAPPPALKAPPLPAPKLAAIVPDPAKKPGTVQLGAFSSSEKADAAWAGLARKPALAGFAKRVLVVENDGKTLYRLRASGGDADELCRNLQAAGAPCTVIK